MIKCMAADISRLMELFGIVEKEEAEIYEYSFEVVIATIINFVAIIVIALLCRKVFETTIYLIGFLPLRSLAGGYHAKTHFRCLLVLIITYLLFLSIISFIPASIMFLLTIIATILSLLIIFIFAPVADINKILSKREIIRFKSRSRISIIVYSLVIIIMIFIPKLEVLVLSRSLGILAVSLAIVAAVIKRKFTNSIFND